MRSEKSLQQWACKWVCTFMEWILWKENIYFWLQVWIKTHFYPETNSKYCFVFTEHETNVLHMFCSWRSHGLEIYCKFIAWRWEGEVVSTQPTSLFLFAAVTITLSTKCHLKTKCDKLNELQNEQPMPFLPLLFLFFYWIVACPYETVHGLIQFTSMFRFVNSISRIEFIF